MASTSNAVLPAERNSSLIEQFCAVTGANDEKAKKMLEVCNWNLEMAINMHVDSDYQENSCADPSVNGIAENDIRAPIPQSRAVLVEEDIGFHYGLRGRKRRPHSVFDAFRDFQAEAQIQEQNTLQENNEQNKKRRTLEDLYRPPLDLMHRGNFSTARDQGQVTNKWLMVNLQDSQEFSCQVLNRDVWSNHDVKKLVSQHFVFWQVYNDSIDGEKYIQFYKPVEFPYIAILDPRTGEKLVTWHHVDSTTLCELIESFLKEHSTPDGSSTSIKNHSATYSLLDQSEEEQLRAAIEASVKESKLINIEDNDSDLETFDSDTESAGDKISSTVNANVYSDQSNDTIDVVGISESNDKDPTLAECSWRDFIGDEEDPKSDLVLRLPDGKREQVTWPCSTKLKSLLLFIDEIGYSPDKYELVTNYPRRNLCQLDLSKSLKEVDLFPREMIFVQLKT
ncbi:UBX domain-containing protein 7-like [Argiope bruennichi]|uniref:UBX domain-containing protein 7 n=1 Tax=Argiope bruennichi TaxID=94029 RepID=A0A8T0G443_ARGBR|nr:UBX domain-containing protein 7-like [Argiope bruennichi]KAF8797295.1 UBX domain-containing protein 7 [Argiope bruennichi]